MEYIGIEQKAIRIIKSMYNNTECAVAIDGNITDWFQVHIGVRQ